MAGAATWLLHSVLMIVGFVALLSITTASLQQAALGATTALVAFLGAVAAILVAALLLGIGLLAYPTGTGALSFQDASGRTYAVSRPTRAKGIAAGALVVAYGVQGIVAIALLLQLRNAAATGSIISAAATVQGILYNWTAAAIVLIVAASLYLSFVRSLRRDIASERALGGIGFLAYSIVNAVGVFMLTIPVLTSFSLTGSLNATGAAIAVLVGTILELLVVPILGIIIFALMIVYGFRLGKLVGGTAPATVAMVGATLPGGVAPPATPVSAFVTADAEYPTQPMTAPPVAAAPIDEFPADSEVLRLQGRIEELDRAIREQKSFLYDADMDFRDGVYDNETHEDLIRIGKEKLANYEREVGERRAELADLMLIPPPPSDLEDG